MRVERLDDYFAKTGNIALSNGAKVSQQPVVDNTHVLGIRAWSAGHLGRRQRPVREQVRAMRAREGWGERSALMRVDVDKRELTRTLRARGGENESGWRRVPAWRVPSFFVVEMKRRAPEHPLDRSHDFRIGESHRTLQNAVAATYSPRQ